MLNADTKVVTIFLRVPKEELEKRLQDRVDKPSPAEIRLRLSRFEYEESRINLYDYVLKNDNLEKNSSNSYDNIRKRNEIIRTTIKSYLSDGFFI